MVNIGNEVDLQYYRLQRVSSGSIDLKVGEPEAVYGPTDVGTGKAKEKAPLSEIIQVLNEHLGLSLLMRIGCSSIRSRHGPPVTPR